jgi:cell division protein FtsN
MKRIILVAFTLALLTSGCKVFKSSKRSDVVAHKTERTAETKVFSVPAPKPAVRENPVSDTMYEPTDKAVTGTPEATSTSAAVGKPVSIRSEKFTLATEDQATYGNKSFFVIVGSFSSNENAGKFKQDLAQQGFKPIILHSETGYYRVCVDTFNDEASARARVQKIRTEFPKYADSWLLIKK